MVYFHIPVIAYNNWNQVLTLKDDENNIVDY